MWSLFLYWTAAVCHGWQVPASPDDSIRERLQGRWTIDFRKTAELLTNPEAFGGEIDPEAISMLAPNLLDFSAKGILVGEYSSTFAAEFRQVDSPDQVSVEFLDGQRRFQVQLINVEADSLQLLAPTTLFGPMVFAYKRIRPQVAPDPANSLVKLGGTWSLDWELSQALWDTLEPADTVKSYLAVIRPQLSNMSTLRIDGSIFLFEPGLTAEPYTLEIENGSTLQLRSSLDRRFRAEVNILGDNLIQLADERRRLYAVFRRTGTEVSTDPVVFLPNELTGFVNYYTLDSRPRLPNLGPPIGIDGQVEIERFDIRRVRAADAVKHADITNMRVDLFIDLKSLPPHLEGGYLVRLVELSDIRDDSGKLLLTEIRRKDIDMLYRPIKPRAFNLKRGGRQGPNVDFVIDAPAIGASSLVQLSGEFEIAPYATKLIVFRDLRSQIGMALTHPLLPDVKFRPKIDDGQFPYLEMNSNLEADDRIDEWKMIVLSEDGFRVSPTSQGGGVLRQGFAQRLPQKFDVWLEVLDVGPSERIKFKFENILLP